MLRGMQSTEVAKDRQRERETRPGWWVEAARVEAGKRAGKSRPISQMKLATLAGRHVSAVSRWETEEGEIDYLAWVGLLALLELPIDWEPTPAPPKPIRPRKTKPH